MSSETILRQIADVKVSTHRMEQCFTEFGDDADNCCGECVQAWQEATSRLEATLGIGDVSLSELEAAEKAGQKVADDALKIKTWLEP